MRPLLLLFATGLSFSMHLSRADELTFVSGTNQVALVELFTSEGCSSCPAADQWLGKLRSDPGLWTHFVPIALHVDYWDHLGWRDRLAKPSFSARQYNYGNTWNTGTIYTPEFAVAGVEWRGWQDDQPLPPPKAGRTTPGNLSATVTDQQQVVVRLAATEHTGETLIARAALLGFNVTNQVDRGENRGSTLKHDFVALTYDNAKMSRDEKGAWTGTINLGKPTGDTRAQAIAVWVERKGDPRPLQATGGWLAGPQSRVGLLTRPSLTVETSAPRR